MIIQPHRITGKKVASYDLKTWETFTVLFPGVAVPTKVRDMNRRLCYLLLHTILPDLAWRLPRGSVSTENLVSPGFSGTSRQAARRLPRMYCEVATLVSWIGACCLKKGKLPLEKLFFLRFIWTSHFLIYNYIHCLAFRYSSLWTIFSSQTVTRISFELYTTLTKHA